MADFEQRIVKGCASFIMDGKRYRTEQTLTRVSDIRETPWGPVDFGFAWFGPQRIIVEEVAHD